MVVKIKKESTTQRQARQVSAGFTRATNVQLRDGYLNRLHRLLRLRRDHYDELNEQGLRLLDRSIFAAYCDCLDIGEAKAAREVLKDVRLTCIGLAGKSQPPANPTSPKRIDY